MKHAYHAVVSGVDAASVVIEGHRDGGVVLVEVVVSTVVCIYGVYGVLCGV